MPEEKVWTEQVKVKAEALRDKVEELIHEGNVRRVVVKNADGKTVMELPLTIGVLGAVAAPMLTAVGAIAGAAVHWTLEIERPEAAKTAKTKTAKKTAKSTP